jgi:hypothetical protein
MHDMVLVVVLEDEKLKKKDMEYKDRGEVSSE